MDQMKKPEIWLGATALVASVVGDVWLYHWIKSVAAEVDKLKQDTARLPELVTNVETLANTMRANTSQNAQLAQTAQALVGQIEDGAETSTSNMAHLLELLEVQNKLLEPWIAAQPDDPKVKKHLKTRDKLVATLRKRIELTSDDSSDDSSDEESSSKKKKRIRAKAALAKKKKQKAARNRKKKSSDRANLLDLGPSPPANEEDMLEELSRA